MQHRVRTAIGGPNTLGQMPGDHGRVSALGSQRVGDSARLGQRLARRRGRGQDADVERTDVGQPVAERRDARRLVAVLVGAVWAGCRQAYGCGDARGEVVRDAVELH